MFLDSDGNHLSAIQSTGHGTSFNFKSWFFWLCVYGLYAISTIQSVLVWHDWIFSGLFLVPRSALSAVSGSLTITGKGGLPLDYYAGVSWSPPTPARMIHPRPNLHQDIHFGYFTITRV